MIFIKCINRLFVAEKAFVIQLFCKNYQFLTMNNIEKKLFAAKRGFLAKTMERISSNFNS